MGECIGYVPDDIGGCLNGGACAPDCKASRLVSSGRGVTEDGAEVSAVDNFLVGVASTQLINGRTTFGDLAEKFGPNFAREAESRAKLAGHQV
jgi:hypothetical protein